MKKKDSAIIRKREAEVAQRLSPSWNGQDPKPVLSPEVISYEVSEKTGAVSYGGLGLLQQVVKWSGLGKAIDQAVTLLKRHQPYHESSKAKRTYRMVILRKTILVEKGQKRLLPQTRYHFYVTNISARTLGTAGVVRENNRRCNQENVIEQLKNGVEALRMPSDTLVANWAYLVIAAQAWNLKAWMGLVLPARLQARELVKMEYRRFLREVIEMPCQILRRGRQLVYRLLDVNGWSRLLLEGSKWLKHRPAT